MEELKIGDKVFVSFNRIRLISQYNVYQFNNKLGVINKWKGDWYDVKIGEYVITVHKSDLTKLDLSKLDKLKAEGESLRELIEQSKEVVKKSRELIIKQQEIIDKMIKAIG